MTTEEDEEIQSIIEYYLHSRAIEFSRIFKGLSGRNSTQLTIVLSIALALSLATSLPMTGLLQERTEASPPLDVEVHSGFWGSIPMRESTNRTFVVENPTQRPLILRFEAIDWSPIMAVKDIEVSWDYDGAPLLPGEAADLTIVLENVGLDGAIIVSLDIRVVGVPF